MRLFHFGSPNEDEREQATVLWLMEYIQARSTVCFPCLHYNFVFTYPGEGLDGKVCANVGDILQFLTGIQVVPPLDDQEDQHLLPL